MILFREKQQIIILCLAVAMAGGFVVFRYLPLQKKIKAAEQVRAVQISVIARTSAQSEQLPVLNEQLLRLQGAVEDYEQQVPEQRELGAFLERITDLMNEHNLREQLIEPGKEINADGLSCVPVSIRCKGRLKQMFEFYNGLEQLDRLIRIERMELVNDSDLGGEVSMQTKVGIYYEG